MITSPTNPQVKLLRSLATDPRDRRRERRFVLEGVRLVATALAHGATLDPLLYAPEQLSTTDAGRELLAIIEQRRIGLPASARVVAAASDTLAPQGVVAATAWPSITPGRPGLVLLLAGVQDPGNLGTLLRSAEAVGVAETLCLPGCTDPYGPKAVRAAMGAHFGLALRQASWDEVDAAVLGVDAIYAAVADATMPYFAADWRQPSALIIGNEAHGIGDEGLLRATRQVSIPMVGRAESLNAAVAGSIMLFESQRQRARGRT